MKNYILSCCSTVDLTLEHLNKREINYISFHYSLDGKEYIDNLGKSLSYEDFYMKLRNGATTKTSQVNVNEFIEYFKKFLDLGLDILHLSVSYGVSGAYNSAILARDILLEDYPNRKIIIINTLAVASGYGLLLEETAIKRDSGLNINELSKWVEDNKLRVQHWFYTSDLSFFIKGGRISKTSGFIGNMLNINPIMHVDKEGKLLPLEKAIGLKRTQKRMLDKVKQFADNKLDYDGKVYISHSDILDDAITMKKMIEDTFLNLDGEVLVNSIGTTIGSHTGPGTLAVFFFGDKRDA